MRKRTLVTGAVMGGIFLSALDVTAVGPAMPRIVGSLGGGELYAFAFSVYAVLSTTTTPVFGRLSDRWGRKPVLLAGIGVFLFGSLLCALAHSMPFFIFARGVQGLGSGALLPVAFTIVGDLYDLKARARIQGYLSGVWGVASVVGPLVGGTLVDTVGWQWIFYLNLPIGALAAVLVFVNFKEEGYPREGQSLDLLGGTFFSGSVLLLLAGMKLDAPLSTPALLAAAVSAALFVYREKRAAQPLFDLSLFKIPVYRSANTAGFFAGAVLLGLTAFLPVYVMNVRGGSALLSGLMLTPMSFGWVLAATFGGRLLLKYDFRKIAFPGLFLLAGTAFGISRIGADTSWAVIAALMFGTGVGFGLSFTTFLVAVQEEVDADRRGQATSGVQFFRQIGGALGVAVLEVVFVSYLADPSLLEARPGAVIPALERTMLMDGFQAALLLAAGFAFLSFLSGALTPGRGRRGDPPPRNPPADR
jgi:EmrB/QacA subfamily drug resistance transporter